MLWFSNGCAAKSLLSDGSFLKEKAPGKVQAATGARENGSQAAEGTMPMISYAMEARAQDGAIRPLSPNSTWTLASLEISPLSPTSTTASRR
jgi:hypothetical protein